MTVVKETAQLSPAHAGFASHGHVDLGLTPQALCSRPRLRAGSRRRVDRQLLVGAVRGMITEAIGLALVGVAIVIAG